MPVNVPLAWGLGQPPQHTVVSMGDAITWQLSMDDMPHTVTSLNQTSRRSVLFDSGVLLPGATFTVQFTEPGVYPYYCRLHGSMTGAVTVMALPATTPHTTTAARTSSPVSSTTTSTAKVVLVAFPGPSSITVRAGTTVVWELSVDTAPHTIRSTAQPPLFSSGILQPGSVFYATFDNPGRFTYVDDYHSSHVYSVVVLPLSGTTASSTASSSSISSVTVGAIVIAVIGGLALLVVLAVVYRHHSRRGRMSVAPLPSKPPPAEPLYASIRRTDGSNEIVPAKPALPPINMPKRPTPPSPFDDERYQTLPVPTSPLRPLIPPLPTRDELRASFLASQRPVESAAMLAAFGAHLPERAMRDPFSPMSESNPFASPPRLPVRAGFDVYHAHHAGDPFQRNTSLSPIRGTAHGPVRLAPIYRGAYNSPHNVTVDTSHRSGAVDGLEQSF